MSRISDIATDLVNLDSDIKALSESLDRLKGEREQKQLELIQEMQEQDLTEFSVDNIGKRFAMKKDIFANCLAQDKPKLLEALIENGYGDIVKTDVNPKSLNALVKEITVNGEEELPAYLKDVLNIYIKPKISVTKKG
jgi:hypothetical protein